MDKFTNAARLCTDGTVTKENSFWHGTDYPCTGSAHYAGDHFLCTSAAHYTPSQWCPLKRYKPRLEAAVGYDAPNGQDVVVVSWSENDTLPGTVFIYDHREQERTDGWVLD